jgi:hypothetical protein
MANVQQTATVVGVFNSVHDAKNAVQHLENQGFSRDDVSLVCSNVASGYDRLTEADRSAMADKTSDVVADAGIGAAIGGVGGLLLGLAGAAIPGIGPILAAGPIVSALTGAGIGAAGGGLIGALTESGVPEEHANYYSEAVRRGNVLVTVRAEGERADRASEVLDQHGAFDVDERVSGWKNSGWSGRYDDKAEPLSREDIERERSFYGSSMAGATGFMDDNTHMARDTETMDNRQEDRGLGTPFARTGDYEGVRDDDNGGTWSRDTPRGAGIGLGRDPMGRPMTPESTLGVSERHDTAARDEPERFSQQLDEDISGSGAGSGRKAGTPADLRDDFERTGGSVSGLGQDARRGGRDVKKGMREAGSDISRGMEGRPDHPGDRPGIGDDAQRAGHGFMDSVKEIGRDIKEGVQNLGSKASRGMEGRPDHPDDQPGIGDDMRRMTNDLRDTDPDRDREMVRDNWDEARRIREERDRDISGAEAYQPRAARRGARVYRFDR